MMESVAELVDWYRSNCDGDWEHSFGVKIETLDNPGWSIEIDLEETSLAKEKFETVDISRTDADWIYCKVEEGIFSGAGGVANLEELILVFNSWRKEILR